MYKVTIEKDGEIIRVENDINFVMLAGDKKDSTLQIAEGECEPREVIKMLALLLDTVAENM